MRYRENWNTTDPKQCIGREWYVVEADRTDILYYLDYDQHTRHSWMRDIVTPDFHRKMSEGEIINNPMYSVVFERESVPQRFIGWYRYNGASTVRDTWGIELPQTDEYQCSQLLENEEVDEYLDQFASEHDQAVTKAWANVGVSEIQILASVGEFPETVKWMHSIMKRALVLIRAVRNPSMIRRILRAEKSSTSNAVFDMWLEFRYAIRPLVFEMHQAIAALQAVVKKTMRKTARGFERITKFSTESTTVQQGYADVTVERTKSIVSNFRAGVLFRIDEDINGLMALWGLDQPLDSIWELTPFSFIIDWFLNVGNVISSWSANPGTTPLTSWISETHAIGWDHEVTAIVPGDIGNPDYQWINLEQLCTGSTSGKVLIKRRLPSPSRALLPRVSINLDMLKIIDLATIGRNILT